MAETPPPFQPQYQQRKSGINPIVWILIALAASCLVCVIAGGVAVMSGVKEMSKVGGCPVTMGFLNESLKDYVKEKGVFPKAEKWESDLKPYYEKRYGEFTKEMEEAQWVGEFLKAVPPGEPMVCSEGTPSTGIAYNKEFAGKKPADFTDIDNEVSFFEVEGVKANNSGVPGKEDEKSSEKVFGKERPRWKYTYGNEMKTKKGNFEVNVSE